MGIFRKNKPKKDLFEHGNFNISNLNLLSTENEFLVSLVYKNYSVDTIYEACASCFGISEERNKDYKSRLNYISRRVKTSHTSILEHSNIIIQAYIPIKRLDNDIYKSVKNINSNFKNDLSDYNTTNLNVITLVSEVKDVCKYLTTITDIRYDNKKNLIVVLTIGGSIRGYRYIFENISNRQNELFISIFETLKLVVEPEFFIDFINDGVMENYINIDIDKHLLENVPNHTLNNAKSNKIDLINMDNIDTISRLTGLQKDKCFDLVSITVDFKNMSRIITQQVTRHRNAITQESQRYVNYSNAIVNSPYLFKDKYDKNHIYNTEIGDLTFDQLGNIMASVYTSLINQGVDKEDARGYLPMNVQCGKLFMTFTLRTLFAFFKLRLDPSAQSEVQKYAKVLYDIIDLAYPYSLMDDIDKYSKPIYKRIIDDNELEEEI